jgi:hypothetical protein
MLLKYFNIVWRKNKIVDFGPGQPQASCSSLLFKLDFKSQPTILKVQPPIFNITALSLSKRVEHEKF